MCGSLSQSSESPTTNTQKLGVNDSEQSTIFAAVGADVEGQFPEQVACELTCSYKGVTTTKHFVIPSGWLSTDTPVTIFAAYGASAIEDLHAGYRMR